MAMFKGCKFISCTEIICVEMTPSLFPNTKLITVYQEKAVFFIPYTKEAILLTLETGKCYICYAYPIQLKSGDMAKILLSGSVEFHQANN